MEGVSLITEPTVLILGAGASMDFGFPSGRQLKKMIVDFLGQKESDQFKQLLHLGHSEEEIKEFRISLFRSGSTSVDAFLEHRGEFEILGKTAIAQSLLPYEKEMDRVFATENNWYEYLFGRMRNQCNDFNRNSVSVLTYNYDRSFERFLKNAYKNTYGIASLNNDQFKIPVVHLHGTLVYSPKMSDERQMILLSRDSIKVIHDEIDDDPGFKKTHGFLTNAKCVIFLGFGYDDTNLRRLKLENLTEGHRIYGSCYGFTTREIEELKRKFPKGIAFGEPSWKVLQFLREKITL